MSYRTPGGVAAPWTALVAWGTPVGMSRRKPAKPLSPEKQAERISAHETARADARARADATGLDHGVLPAWEGSYRVFPMPTKAKRQGYELSCEVVHPTILDRCLPGHGPCA